MARFRRISSLVALALLFATLSGGGGFVGAVAAEREGIASPQGHEAPVGAPGHDLGKGGIRW